MNRQPIKEFRVRPMQNKDLSDWGDMRCALWPDEDEMELRQELELLLETATDYRGWIVVNDYGHAIGFAEASVRNIVDGCDSGPAAYLEAIWITPEHRRKGLARHLLDTIKSWASENGLGEMGSDCKINNATGQAWHRAMGFAETGRSVNYKCSLN